MKYIFGLIGVMALLSCSPVYAPQASGTGTVTGAVPDNMEASILRFINDHRRSKGLGNLQTEDAATQQAVLHSKNMATGKTAFGHDGFDQRLNAIKKAMGVSIMSAAAENVAEGQLSAREVVNGWLNSPGHKKNIEGNYTLTGIGVYRDKKGVLYFTQIFLRK